MKTNSKQQLSNPFSTGGGGPNFEIRVHASFVALMCTSGYAPVMPGFVIKKIKLQGKFAGYDTDDCIIFLEKSSQERKIFIQIKHKVSIRKNDRLFFKVIQAAWNDFNNTNLFLKGRDIIALITGPLTASDIEDTRTILEWARHSENAKEFIDKVGLAKFSSKGKQEKLKIFRMNLQKANGGNQIDDETLFTFLRHYHLLGYDLDIKSGVILSLLHSLIGQFSNENVEDIWARLAYEVQSANQNAGTIKKENLPEDLKIIFQQRLLPTVIPSEYIYPEQTIQKRDWNRHRYAAALAIANLLGSWDEKNKADIKIISQLTGEEYSTWISRLREIIQEDDSPISQKNGKWEIIERKPLWKLLGKRIFDLDLEKFTPCAVTILSEIDPRFELPPEKRYIHRRTFEYSPDIRKGVAETLALLGNQSDELPFCSAYKKTVISSIRKIFRKDDWRLWGSLNNLLPVIAESAPEEFLKIIEESLEKSPCPFDELFSQEGKGIIGENYLVGLFWAMEALAWDENLLVSVSVILADLALHDPGGSWNNRPLNSLRTILLPWLPQTTASIEKRKVALKAIQNQIPTIAWRLIISLLPNPHQSSGGSHKPIWRNIILNEEIKKVDREEYIEQINFYSEQAIAMAGNDIEKLSQLVNHLDKLPQHFLEEVLNHLSSDSIINSSENQRLMLWEALTGFSVKCKRFLPSLSPKIENTLTKFSPENPSKLYHRLFSGRYIHIDEGNPEDRRNQVIKDIFDSGGVNAVIQFAESVDSPGYVGQSFSLIADEKIDINIIPQLLNAASQKLAQFLRSYIWSRRGTQGWEWVDSFDRSQWLLEQTTRFLCHLPFCDETWTRAARWLQEAEGEYWKKTTANPYETTCDLEVAINKLTNFGRPNAAVKSLYKIQSEKKSLNIQATVKTLLAVVSSSEPPDTVEAYQLVEIIKTLQNNPCIDPNDLFQIEWIYLELLDQYNGASPKVLEKRLATDSTFFCEVIRLIYRSNKENMPDKEPNEREKAQAVHAYTLLEGWRIPPGLQPDDTFSDEQFSLWIENTKSTCDKSGHLNVALMRLGQVLIYCPADSNGLWINKTVANFLNGKDVDEARNGFITSLYNSRGVHLLDLTGKSEHDLSEKYMRYAIESENAGYQRLSMALKELSEIYAQRAKCLVVAQ